MMAWRTKRFRVLVTGTAITAVLIVLFVPTVAGGWAPVLHWTCELNKQVATQGVQIPGLLLNSPYGGRSWANVTYPVGFLPDDLASEGTQESNGGAAWAGFESNLTVFSLANASVWGPGANSRCSQQFTVVLAPIGDPSVGITILGPGNMSDQREPTVLGPNASNSISFFNGFLQSNLENVSTCGGAAQSLPLVSSTYLTLWAHFDVDGTNHTASFDLPIVEAQFHYWFPANFGIWQIDNLSASGGPGGGWSFSYASCP
jgi:hypothetical protein